MDTKLFRNKPWTSPRLGWAGYKRLGNLEVKHDGQGIVPGLAAKPAAQGTGNGGRGPVHGPVAAFRLRCLRCLRWIGFGPGIGLP